MSFTLYRKRPGGTWYAEIRTGKGKREQHCTWTKDKHTAKQVAADMERKALGVAVEAQGPEAHSVTQALDVWFAHGLTGKAPGTVDYYDQKAVHLLRLMGNHDVNGLTREAVSDYVELRRGEGAGEHTISKELVALRQCLKYALERGVLHRDPTPLIPRIKPAYVPRSRFLTEAEFRALVDSFKRTHCKTWLWLAVYTGGRKSEIDRLRWSDVDLDGGWLTLPGTKTEKARRPIPIHPELRAVLASIPRRPDGLVAGHWASPSKDFTNHCKRLGLPKCSPNDLRRTFASWLVQRGTPLKVVAKLLGHTTTVMVDRVYGHLETKQLEDAVATLPTKGPQRVVKEIA